MVMFVFINSLYAPVFFVTFAYIVVYISCFILIFFQYYFLGE